MIQDLNLTVEDVELFMASLPQASPPPAVEPKSTEHPDGAAEGTVTEEVITLEILKSKYPKAAEALLTAEPKNLRQVKNSAALYELTPEESSAMIACATADGLPEE